MQKTNIGLRNRFSNDQTNDLNTGDTQEGLTMESELDDNEKTAEAAIELEGIQNKVYDKPVKDIQEETAIAEKTTPEVDKSKEYDSENPVFLLLDDVDHKAEGNNWDVGLNTPLIELEVVPDVRPKLLSPTEARTTEARRASYGSKLLSSRSKSNCMTDALSRVKNSNSGYGRLRTYSDGVLDIHGNKINEQKLKINTGDTVPVNTTDNEGFDDVDGYNGLQDMDFIRQMTFEKNSPFNESVEVNDSSIDDDRPFPQPVKVNFFKNVSNESNESNDSEIVEPQDNDSKDIESLDHTDGRQRHASEPTARGKFGKVLNQIKLRQTQSIDMSESVKESFVDCLNQLKAVKENPEMDEETKWIRNHIKRRECSSFTPIEKQNINPDQVQCQCGYTHGEHTSRAKASLNQTKRWDSATHSKQQTTNAFGEMEFVGYGGNVGRYIRVDVNTSTHDMLELMMKVWGMDKPNLVISVTGGAKNFQMNKRLKETFRRGLMKTALTTGAWIITGGTHAGVMKHVGEAVKDFGIASTSQNPVIAIGIAPWGCVQNKDVLIDDSCMGKWPAGYRIEKEQRPKESFLDPNHSHFILVDNATQHKFAVEIPFRARLENEVAKIKTETGENAVSVPIVLLVLEGGPGTLETVHQSIKNNTPAVIVKGSGRAADILAYAYQNCIEKDIDAKDHEGKKQQKSMRYMEDSVEVEVMEMVEKEFGNKEIMLHMGRIKDCLNNYDLMSVFELDNKASSNEIDVAMLQALLKANKDQVMDQLRLGLAWNRIDVAKSDIFTDDKRWPTGSLDDVMFSAIQLNRVDFVELFLDHGVSLREFLTKRRLLSLYNKIPQNCLLRTLLAKTKNKEDTHRKNFSLLDVGLLMQELLGDYYRPYYTTRADYATIDADNLLDNLTTKQAQAGGFSGLKAITKMALNVSGISDKEPTTKKNNNAPPADFDNPMEELFIWAVLMIRQDMAKLFWAEGKDAIAAALVANGLLRAMKESTQDTEVIIKIQENMDEWSNLAIGVLSECYSTDEKKAQDLLVRELNNWGDSTCMLIAVKSDNKDFISQTACQSLLNSVWMGKMMQENSTFKLLVCIFFPPLMLVFVKFQSDEEAALAIIKTKSQETQEPHEKKSLRRQTTFQRDNTLPSIVRNSTMSIRTDMDEVKEEPAGPTNTQLKAIWNKVFCFFNAPVIIFMYNVISYLVFLMLFSYVLIFSFGPKVSSAEIVLMIWVFTIFTEEIRQVATTTSSSMGTKLQSYITDTWNVVDIITIGLFIIGMVLRFLPYPNTFEAARVFLALNFVSFFLRLLHIFSVHKELGPKLVMIGRMVQDLMYFVVILMVFVVSYAIASHSVLFPNSPVRWSTIVSLIRRAYWNIYGELFLDEIEGDPECTFDEVLWTNGTYPRCPTDVGRVVVPIMMGMYMLLANVLLLNLLIAMFSYTFQKIQDNTDKHWFFQRYSLIYEYYTRPVLCPPLILFSHFYLIIKFLLTLCCCQPAKPVDDEDDFRRRFKNERELVQWENVIADAFHHKTKLKGSESMEFKVHSTHDSLQMLINRIDEIQEHQATLSTTSPGQPASSGSEVNPLVPPTDVVMKMPPTLDLRLHKLETQMDNTAKSLEWIVAALQKSHGVQNVTMAALPDPEKEDFKAKDLERKKKKAKAQKEKLLELFNRSYEYHVRSRQSPYLGSDVHRVTLQDDQVSWKENLQDYSPPSYTSPEVYAQPPWADPDIMALPVQDRLTAISSFNTIDKTFNCNRMSFLGQYQLTAGLPLNPKGRTGLQGRGCLGRWGPNHAGDPVVTRWRMKDQRVEHKHGKPVLEFVAVMRADNQMWALPGNIAQPGTGPADHLKADFTEEALGHLDGDTNAKTKSIKKKLKKLWKKGVQIYEGYADDPRNTDNAWLETTVYNYHDDDGTILQHFNLTAGDTVELASWISASSKVSMHGSHLYFIKLVCDKLGANF